MVDQPIDFETVDNLGRTEAFSVAATTSVQSVPAVAAERISGIQFWSDDNNLQISYDGGTSFFDLPKKPRGSKDVKGEVTQIQVKTSSGTATLNVVIDFEDT